MPLPTVFPFKDMFKRVSEMLVGKQDNLLLGLLATTEDDELVHVVDNTAAADKLRGHLDAAEYKNVVLGLITTKTPTLETVDDLRKRIDAAAKYLPLEQMALSPQCGFASDVVGNMITPDDQKRKLERVVEVARQVWG